MYTTIKLNTNKFQSKEIGRHNIHTLTGLTFHSSNRKRTMQIYSKLHYEIAQFRFSVAHSHRCLQGNAPQYLVDCCKSMTDAASCQRLRSASRHQLIVPRHRRTKFGRRAFSAIGPTAWNLLPDSP